MTKRAVPTSILAAGVGDRPGVYVLLFELGVGQNVAIGALGELRYPAAWYGYVGSAMGGLSRRVVRYLRPVERPRWHVDYLLPYGQDPMLIAAESEERIECLVAAHLMERLPVVRRFGSSDCRCEGHLFTSDNLAGMVSAVKQAFSEAGAESFAIPDFRHREPGGRPTAVASSLGLTSRRDGHMLRLEGP